MKSKKIILISTLLLLSLFVSSCSSTVYSSTGWHGMAASPDVAYLAAGTQVYAVDLKTGIEKWRYPAKPDAKIAFYANPVLAEDGQLLVPSYDHKLYSIDPTTGSGRVLFTGSTNRLVASPLVTQNMIYQPSSDWKIYAIDMTGKLIWDYKTGGPIWAEPTTDPNCGCVYVASMDHSLYSFDAATGRKIWESNLGGALVGTAAIGPDGTLYIGTFGKEMIALNGSDGSIKWRYTTQDWVWSGPVLVNDSLFFGDLSGNFYGLNAADGTALWRIQPQNAIVNSPAVSGDKLYFATEADTLYTVNTAGDILASKVIGGVIYSSPIIVGDTILVSPTGFDSLLVALNLDGNQQWTFTPAK